MFYGAVFCVNAQTDPRKKMVEEAWNTYHNKGATAEQKLDAGMIIINRYAGVGGAMDDTAQQLIYEARERNNVTSNDTISYYLQIWQTEIFYYAGLYQFGVASANKQIQYGKTIQDNYLLGSAYFFKAINLLELDSFQLAKTNLENALAIYPMQKPQRTYRKLAFHNQLVNVYAEVFFEQKQYDSALYFNAKAMAEAYAENSRRGVPASHLVQGKIFLAMGIVDSANYHFNKTIEFGGRNHHEDLVLAALGKKIRLSENNFAVTDRYLDSGFHLINTTVINNAFKTAFYIDAIAVCRKQGKLKELEAIQTKLLTIRDIDTKTGNALVQNITEQMLSNENNLLKLQVGDAQKQQQLRSMQLLIAVLLFGFIIAIFLYRLKRKNTQYALLQQKSMIARGLHDDLGASISSISMYAEVALQRMPANTNAQLPLNNIQDTAHQISSNLKDIIWFINPQNETFEKLVDRIRQYAEPICLEKNILFALQYDKHPMFAHLSVNDKKNIYLIIKEAINNALKYAMARHINIHFQYLQKSIRIVIQDDGNGFPENTKQGNGIHNMYARALELKGSLHIASKHGTTITLTI